MVEGCGGYGIVMRGRLQGERPDRSSTGAPGWPARDVLLLACVLGLSTVDTSTVGAIAGPLKRDLSIDNTQLGLLASASTLVAAIATIPLGALVDRVDRVRLLSGAVIAWSAVMLACGAATSFATLLTARLVLGILVAVTGPVVASLTGDLVPAAQRGQVYGRILSGELVGIGVGLVGGGEIAAALSWRWSFWLLALPGFVLAVVVRTSLSEPRRSEGHSASGDGGDPQDRQLDPMVVLLRQEGIGPRRDRVITDDPTRWGLWRVAAYLLTTRTVVALVVASGLGYFFLAGFKTFGVIYIQGRFGIGQALATLLLAAVGLGALLGVQLTGRVADRLVRARHVAARPVVAGASIVLAAVCVAPALLTTSAPLALGLFALTAVGLGGINPPLDAARLDLVHPRLWGRAEALRTLLRQSLEAGAPLLVGYLSIRLSVDVVNAGPEAGSSGLGRAFLLLASTLVVAAALLLWTARRQYPQDVATALESMSSPGPRAAPAHLPDD